MKRLLVLILCFVFMFSAIASTTAGDRVTVWQDTKSNWKAQGEINVFEVADRSPKWKPVGVIPCPRGGADIHSLYAATSSDAKIKTVMFIVSYPSENTGRVTLLRYFYEYNGATWLFGKNNDTETYELIRKTIKPAPKKAPRSTPPRHHTIMPHGAAQA